MARRNGVDAGARITQRWAAAERDAKAGAEMAIVRAQQQRDAERAILQSETDDWYEGSEAPPEWDAAW